MDTGNADERPAKRARLSPPRNADGIEASVTQSASLEIVPDPKELQVGITTYISEDTVPFKAFLKTRYTDFLVNEILPSGQVVHLKSIKVADALLPAGAKSGRKEMGTSQNNKGANVTTDEGNDGMEVQSEAKPQDQATPEGTNEISEEDKQKLTSYLDEKAVSELLLLHESILKNPQKKVKDHPVVRTAFTTDRSLRGEIHGAIRRIFSSKIDSSTDKDGTLVLIAANPNSRYNRTNPKDNPKPSWRPGKLGWMERGGEYLHFTLYKENKDTMEAISWLTRIMKMNAKVFQFAGTKDRRAVTAQRVSAHRVDAERLAAQNRTLRNAAVGDFEYQPHGLELGDLTGNEFTITLRECEFADMSNLSVDEKVSHVKRSLQASLDKLQMEGFLNYYGLQRFGTFATRTDATGLHILKGDFRAACEAILEYDISSIESKNDTNPDSDSTSKPYVNDDHQRSLALHTYEKSNNLHNALEMLPRKFSAEAALLRHLHRQSSDYFGALMTIHRNLRMMYIHAYQSLVWNNAITNRWNLYKDKVVEGDLVLVKEHKDKENLITTDGSKHGTTTDGTKEPESNVVEFDADGDPIILPQSHDRSQAPDEMFDRARALTIEEASSGLYNISDIVLPLPGHDILYPSNASGKFYETFMNENGGLNPHDMKRKQRDFSLTGGYRKMISRVNVSADAVQVHVYKRDEEQFVKTDMEVLRAREGDANQGDVNGNGNANVNGGENEKTSENVSLSGRQETGEEKIAAVLRFQLGSSQYATMALRELSRGGIAPYKMEFGSAK